MKNVKLWRQIDFSGGEDIFSPPHLIPENTCARILNLLVGDNEKPLVVRGGFQEWSYGLRFDGDIITVFPYNATLEVAGSSPTNYGKAKAFLTFSHYGTDSMRMHVCVGDDTMTVPTNDDDLPDQIQWTELGQDLVVEQDEVEIEDPFPVSERSIANLPLIGKTFTPAIGANTSMGDSYWASETDDGHDYGNNDDYWTSELASGDSIVAWASYEQHISPYVNTYWDRFYVSGLIAELPHGDKWKGEVLGSETVWNYSNGWLRFYRENFNTMTTVTGETILQPNIDYPRFVYRETLEGANRLARMVFGYDATYRGLAIHVYYRGANSQGDWTRLTGIDKPIVLCLQTDIPEAYRYTMDAQGNIPFEYRMPHAQVEFKFEAVPNKHAPFNTWNYEKLGGFFKTIIIE